MNNFLPQVLINNTYLIVEKIGEGGFGEVYKAVDLSFRNFVAIKKLFRNYSENINFVSMFYKEASIAKTLVHDNIVRVSHFWVDEDSKEFYILMDYVNGKSLEYIINKCRKQNIKIPFEFIWYVAVNLAKVLHYLHLGAKHPITGEPYNLVYMDLSPGNVLISFEGKIKITDFGVTKTKQSIEQDKRTIIAGKYAYMSPEQILGEKVDFRTDIFSLGIILYEMLTYEDFLKKDVEEIKQIITQAKFDFERLKEINIPQEFISILEKTLKKNKEERYSSALEIYRDLRSLFKEKFEEAIKKYEKMRAKILEISLPHTPYALACYYIIAPSEASANLARYDGIKYGFSAGNQKQRTPSNLLNVYFESRGKGFGVEVRRRIMLGTFSLSVGYYDAYYLRAAKVRSLIIKDFEKAFEKVDVIFTPTSPTLPFKVGEKVDDPLKMYLSDIFTVSISLAGLPAISISVGKVKNLPVGLQIVGKPFEENKIFEVAKIYELSANSQ